VYTSRVSLGRRLRRRRYFLIPEEAQPALWTLLGGYADTLEPWDED